MKAVLFAALVLGGCHAAEPAADTPGARLEAAANAAGMIPDPRSGSLVGSWARDTDRLCAIPSSNGQLLVGVSIDYGPGQQCAGRGIATRTGEQVRFTLGAGCTVNARFDGDALVFPAEMPEACEALCTGRASLASMRVDRIGESLSEARMMRSPNGQALCTS